MEVAWEREWELPPLLESPVHAPALLATIGEASVVTVDYGDNSIKRIDAEGRLGWAFGRTGGGPREFSNPTGLSVGSDGNIYVTDSRNRRVTVLSAGGEFLRAVPIGDVTRLTVAKDGTILALRALSGSLVSQFGPDGSLVDSWSPRGFDDSVEGFAREGIVSGGRWTDYSLIAFLHSGFLVHVAHEGSEYRGELFPSIEPFDFGRIVSWSTLDGRGVVSRVDPSVPDGAKWLDHDTAYFYVGFEGATDHQDRIVDLYCVDDGRYAGSLRLPEAVAWGAVFADGRIAALVYQPIPHVKVWRWWRTHDGGAIADSQTCDH